MSSPACYARLSFAVQHNLPMLASAPVLGAQSDFEAIRSGYVAITAAQTAGSAVVDPQPDLAKRTLGLDH